MQASPYGLRVLTVAGVYALAAIGFQIIFGLAGSLSLAQGAFFGVGAYATGILGSQMGWDFPATFTLSLVIPLGLSLLVGLPVLRLESHYFALATMGIAQVALLVAINWPDLTGGANGLSGVPPVRIGEWQMPRGLPMAALVWAIVALGGGFAWWLARGAFGRALVLLCDDPMAAACMGLDVGRLRLTAFALSAVYGGAAGALSVHTQRVVSPEVLEFPVMVTILTIAVVGGRGRIAGAIVGALLLLHLPEWFRALEQGYLVLHGAALLLTIVLAPNGLLGLLDRLLPPHPRRLPTLMREPVSIKGANAATDEVLLQVSGLARAFGGVRAVDGVDLALQRGQIMGLIGPNGSGKTTVINLITGLERPDSGQVLFNGVDITAMRADRVARLGVARGFQSVRLPEDQLVIEAVAAARLVEGVSQSQAEAEALWALSRIGSADLAGRRCGDLPAGQRRWVEIARALARRPALLLLDEPAAGLTDQEKVDLAGHLRGVATSGTAILLVEHDMDFLLPLADQVVCLDQGRVLAQGRPQDVRNHPGVIAAYLGGSV